MSDEDLEGALRRLLGDAPQPPPDLVSRAVARLPERRSRDPRILWLSFASAVGVILVVAFVTGLLGSLAPVAPSASPTTGPIAAPTPTPAPTATGPTGTPTPSPAPTEPLDGIGGPGDTTPPPTIAWVRQFGSSRVEGGGSVAFGDGRIYVAGWTQGSLPGHANAGIEGNEDGFVVAYRLDGSRAWSDQFGSPSRDQVTDVAAVGDRVYVAGWTTGLPGQPPVGGTFDAFVRAYRSDGTVLWTRQFGTSGGEFGTFGVAADADSVYVVGMTQGAFAGQTLSGPQDAFVARFGTDGTLAWVRQFGTTAIDQAYDVAIGAGGVAVAGVTQGSFPGQTLAGAIDAFVRLVDTNGAERWTRQFGTPDSEDWTHVGYSGSDVYAGGATFGTLPGQTRAGSWDAFTGRLSDAGTSAWLAQFGSTQADVARANAPDASGVVVVGRRGSVAFAQRIARDGAMSWRVDLTGPTSAEAWGVALAADRIVVGGTVSGAFAGETAAGGGDAFVALLEPARAPTVAVDESPVTVREGDTARATGTFADANAGDTVTLEATRGSVTAAGRTSGTWSWEVPIADGPADGGPVTISATDQTGLRSTVRFDVVATNVPPTATFQSPAEAEEGSGFRLALTDATDPSAADTAAGFTYAFDCGNGQGLGPATDQSSVDCVAGAPGIVTVGGRIADRDGGSRDLEATVTVVEAPADTLPPEVGAPASAFPLNKALGTSRIPVRTSWTVVDDASGITRTQLQESTDGGRFRAVTLPSGTATAVTRQLAPGHTFRYRSRATDGAGNRSPWVTGPAFRLRVTQSESTSIAYGGAWTRGPLSGAYGGTSTSSTTAGDVATSTFTGRGFAWVGSRGPGYGRAEVRVDGSLEATVDLARATAQSRRILFAIAFESVGKHTVEIRLLDSNLGHLDALLFMR